MKNLYFTYPKYLFLLFLIYVSYILSGQPDVKFGYTELIMGILLPYLPVWLSLHIAMIFDEDLASTPLNIIALSTPAIVIIGEIYLIITRSLMGVNDGSGLIGAFVLGTLIFFILYGMTVMLSVFVKTDNKQLN